MNKIVITGAINGVGCVIINSMYCQIGKQLVANGTYRLFEVAQIIVE